MTSTGTCVSGLLVQPLANQLSEWLAEGKLDEATLEHQLGSDALALLDHPLPWNEWLPLETVEPMVSSIADQLGGSTGFAELSAEIVGRWLDQEPSIARLLTLSHRSIDGLGFIVSQSCERLVRPAAWSYEGGRERFSVGLAGLDDASTNVRTLLGAVLARLAESADAGRFDVRFDGIDEGELVVFGERGNEGPVDESSRSRLHRAALIC